MTTKREKTGKEKTVQKTVHSVSIYIIGEQLNYPHFLFFIIKIKVLKFANFIKDDYLCVNNLVMEVSFEHEYLLKLYTEGRSDDKKHRYQPQIIKGYQKAINFLRTTESIEALWQIKSLHYEVLKGDKAWLSSVRVNDQYRKEFKVTLNEEHPILTICHIIELSNHYQ